MARFTTDADMSDRTKIGVLLSMYNKRISVLNALGTTSQVVPDPEIGDDLPQFWYNFQKAVLYIARQYVRHLDDDGEEIDWAGVRMIETWPARVDSGNTTAGQYTSPTFSVVNFPPPNGFTRKFPRVIKSLSDAGSTGQIARFEASSNTLITPTLERGNSGQLFEYSGGAWIPDTTGATDPDHLTDYGPIQSGDYVGLWIANEIEAAIRLLQWIQYNDGFVGSTALNTYVQPLQTRSGTSTISESAAASNFTSASLVTSPTGIGFVPWARAYSSESGTTGISVTYTMGKTNAKVVGNWPNPAGLNRKVAIYIRVGHPNHASGSTQHFQLDDFSVGTGGGLSTSPEMLTQLFDEIETTGTSYDSVTDSGLTIGEVSSTPVAWATFYNGETSNRGWQTAGPDATKALSGGNNGPTPNFAITGCFAIAKYDVVGGFDDPAEV